MLETGKYGKNIKLGKYMNILETRKIWENAETSKMLGNLANIGNWEIITRYWKIWGTRKEYIEDIGNNGN